MVFPSLPDLLIFYKTHYLDTTSLVRPVCVLLIVMMMMTFMMLMMITVMGVLCWDEESDVPRVWILAQGQSQESESHFFKNPESDLESCQKEDSF